MDWISSNLQQTRNMMVLLMPMNCAIGSSNAILNQIHSIRLISDVNFLIVKYFSCHIFDEFNIYDKYLTNKTSTVYLTINRLVRMISNFARTGWAFLNHLIHSLNKLIYKLNEIELEYSNSIRNIKQQWF